MPPTAPPTSPTKGWQPDHGGYPTIFERYQILGIIGQGGMGTVFKGYHVNLKRFVAIKTLRMGDKQSPKMLERFRREMEVIGQMDHPNVVRATDAGEKNGVFYLVMEHLIGLDLARLISQRGRLEVAEACELTRQAALGLHYIHQTLVHRDIKPSNLMLTSAGLVKVLDLGLARLGEGEGGELTPQGFAVGTFAYIAPEQATADRPIDGRADIYSLGCTFYKLLTGQAPFSGPGYDNTARQIHAHCSVPVTAAVQFSSIPDEIKPLLLRMMAKKPGDRFQTGQEVADAMAPFAAGSQTMRLVDTTGVEQAPVAPLSEPFPEELSRLTVAAGDTSQSSSVGADAVVLPKSQRIRTRMAWFVVASILIASLTGLAWVILPNLRNRGDENQTKANQPPDIGPLKAGPREMDGFLANTHVNLLDKRPVAVGNMDAVSGAWRWDKDRELVTVDGPNCLLLQLGATSRNSFTVESAIAQYPWTGSVGLFWGYREDQEKKASKKTQQEFAWLHFIMIDKESLPTGNILAVQRGTAFLKFDGNGRIWMNPHHMARHEIPEGAGGEKILRFTVMSDHLRKARLDSDDLPLLFPDFLNKKLESRPSQGAFGLFTMRYSAVFSKARFMAH